MTMTPIHKIPLESDSPPLHAIVRDELGIDGKWTIQDAFLNSLVHDKDEDRLSVLLDWAMQIRNEMGISWGESIRAASILFYG
jgi:hypothetical protein